MYKKLLAPLDGSELSECTLEHLRALVSGCQIPEVIILRVIEPIPAQTIAALAEAGGRLLQEMEDNRQAETQQYIQGIAAKLQKEGVNVKPVMVSGYAADEILNYANNNKVDLIIMSTHGRSGISRFVMGSVTNKVLSHSLVPVLTVIPKGCRIAVPA
jgi:nucleotide-binding universal stress UspA family protein